MRQWKNIPGRPRNEWNSLVEAFYDKMGFLERFQDGYKKDLTSNKLISAKLDRRLMTKEAKLPTISKKIEYEVDLKKV